MIVERYSTCPRCAGTVGEFVPLADGCTHCRARGFSFEGVIRLGVYEGLLREVILRMKHSTGEGLAEVLGDLWAVCAEPRLRALGVQAVVPVPLHWRRRLARGYNQSETLARGLAHLLRIPCRPRWLRRIRHTPLQTQQAASARPDNVRHAFRAASARELAGKTVLLVDDVFTTGSTASEASRALRTREPVASMSPCSRAATVIDGCVVGPTAAGLRIEKQAETGSTAR